MARRIMREFRMNEISGVDKPAQKGAVACFMKRDATSDDGGLYLAKAAGESSLPEHVEAYLKRTFTQDQRDHLASTGAALPDGSFPISNRSDLRNAVRAYGRAKNKPKAKAHIVSRARTLGATSALPEAWKSANFPLCAHLTNDQVMEGLEKAVMIHSAAQQVANFNGEQANAECREYANALMEEIGEAVCSLRTVFDDITDDPAISDKQEALQESFDQFKAHLKGIIPEGIENGLAAAALHEAGFKVNERGALTKRETEMGFDIRKSLGLPATATDAEVEKAMGEKLAAFGKAETTMKTLANILKMSADHTAYMNNEKAKMPEGGKEAFANMSAEERDSHIKANPCQKAAKTKKNKGDEEDEEDDEDDAEKCIKTDAGVIRKSEVGDAMFAFIKSQQLDIAKMRDERATAEFSKRADTGMKYIGKADEIGGLLQSIAKLSGGDKVAEAVAKKFEQLNEVMKKGGDAIFKEVGSGAAPAGGSFAKAKDQIETIAKDIVAKEKVSIYKARTLARDRNPDLVKQEQAEAAEARKAA